MQYSDSKRPAPGFQARDRTRVYIYLLSLHANWNFNLVSCNTDTVFYHVALYIMVSIEISMLVPFFTASVFANLATNAFSAVCFFSTISYLPIDLIRLRNIAFFNAEI